MAARVAAQAIGFFLYNGLRFFIAAGLLLLLMRGKVNIQRKDIPLILLAAGVLFGASTLQQAGLSWTTAANAGFFTGLYVIIVPIFLWLFFHQVIHLRIWIAAFIAALGALLLSTGKLTLQLAPGDALELAGAFFWALHLIVIGIASRKIHPLPLTFGQLIVAGSVHLALAGIFENNSMNGLSISAWSILYTGVFSIGLGYALQAYGQRHAPPADAAIILSLESVLAAFFGIIFLNEKLRFLQWIGGFLILGAILLAQLQSQSPKNKPESEPLTPHREHTS